MQPVESCEATSQSLDFWNAKDILCYSQISSSS